MVVGHREDVDREPALRAAIRSLIEGGGGALRSARDHSRQCRGDCKGGRHVGAEFADEAEARVARELCHDISLTFGLTDAAFGRDAMLLQPNVKAASIE